MLKVEQTAGAFDLRTRGSHAGARSEVQSHQGLANDGRVKGLGARSKCRRHWLVFLVRLVALACIDAIL